MTGGEGGGAASERHMESAVCSTPSWPLAVAHRQARDPFPADYDGQRKATWKEHYKEQY